MQDLLSNPRHAIVQVHPPSGTVGFAVAGGPTVVLTPAECRRIRDVLDAAADQAQADGPC